MDTSKVEDKDITTVKGGALGSSQRSSDTRPDCVPSIEALQEENERLNEKVKCKICLKENIHFVFMPCAHLVACLPCGMTASKCMKCFTVIVEKRKIYLE
ncbi:E3 ubiquitin-protein ligase XIAP-like [Ylistrum balloti]|uniref:E3 ubiquitin-protein ligase XIAP-like n=1 Tax=Ylistrum balloti TaxID=509963 RepID=UPI002905CB7A|nr:E3 ubiquitin-protein ligase XIAP-like [Ylistrum balloti]